MNFEDSIHKVTLSGNEISSILYALEGWIQANDEYNEGGDLSLDIDNVFTALEEVADSWEGEFADPKVTNSDKVYPEVEDVPEQVYKEWLTSTDDNYGDKVISSQELEGDISTVKDSDYAECVDTLVDNMKSTK